MLGWLFPRPPVRVQEKAWIEYRFAWLVEQLGARRLLDAEVIEPTDKSFPDAYHGDCEAAEAMYRRICGFMQVDPAEMRFEVWPADDLPEANGHYDYGDPQQRPALRVADKQVAEPEALVATLAHEIAYHILLGGGLMTGEEDDHELTTDLLPCVVGLGIFAANSTIRFSSGSGGGWSWWNVERNGYMPSHWIGYALAMFSWLREERSPRWARHLRLDAREPLSKGLRYLRRKRDCYLAPEQVGMASAPTLIELDWRMQHGTPTARIHAMWDLAKDAQGESHAEQVKRLLRHPTPAVRAVAMETTAALGQRDETSIREVTSGLQDSDEQVRVTAAKALGSLVPREEMAVVELGRALADDVTEVVSAAALALREFGERAAPAEKDALKALHNALIGCDYALIDLLLDVLRNASSDAGQSINEYFFERDPEFRQAAIDALYDFGESGSSQA